MCKNIDILQNTLEQILSMCKYCHPHFLFQIVKGLLRGIASFQRYAQVKLYNIWIEMEAKIVNLNLKAANENQPVPRSASEKYLVTIEFFDLKTV